VLEYALMRESSQKIQNLQARCASSSIHAEMVNEVALGSLTESDVFESWLFKMIEVTRLHSAFILVRDIMSYSMREKQVKWR
jgi:hypothetical protein